MILSFHVCAFKIKPIPCKQKILNIVSNFDTSFYLKQCKDFIITRKNHTTVALGDVGKVLGVSIATILEV